MSDAPATNPAPGPVDKEVADGKVFAILSYIIQPFWLVPVIMRNNEFALYHAKQAMMICLTMICLFIPAIILSFIPFVGCIVLPLWLLCVAGAVTLIVFGIINTVNNRYKPLPVIGPYAIKFFKGITKKPATPAA